MGISIEQYKREDGLIMRVYAELRGVVDRWRAVPENGDADAVLTGWPAVDLFERLVLLLLRSKGYDDGLIDLAMGADPPEGWTLADLDAELERTRGIALPDGWQAGDPLPVRS